MRGQARHSAAPSLTHDRLGTRRVHALHGAESPRRPLADGRLVRRERRTVDAVLVPRRQRERGRGHEQQEAQVERSHVDHRVEVAPGTLTQTVVVVHPGLQPERVEREADDERDDREHDERTGDLAAVHRHTEAREGQDDEDAGTDRGEHGHS